MPQELPQWTKADELKLLMMEEPTAAAEHLRDNLAQAHESLRGCFQSIGVVISLMHEPQIISQRPD